MPIPPYHEMLLPLLCRSADGEEWAVAALRGPIANDFGPTDAERQELLPSKTQNWFVNRLRWGKIYRKQAGLVTPARHGVFAIYKADRDAPAENLTKPRSAKPGSGQTAFAAMADSPYRRFEPLLHPSRRRGHHGWHPIRGGAHAARRLSDRSELSAHRFLR